jgi:hypothetical protein
MGACLYEGSRCRTSTKWTNARGWMVLVTYRVWKALGFAPENTLHDLRYGETYQGEFVWVFEISGAVPAAHNVGWLCGSVSERQPPMYFRLGGGSLKGVAKPGDMVWSRVFIEDGKLKADSGPGAGPLRYLKKRRNAVGASRHRSGPLCTRFCMEFRAIR